MKIAAFAAALIVAAWMLRFDVTQGSDREANSAFMLDRWTGQVYHLSGASKMRLQELEPRPLPRQRPATAEEFLNQK